MLRVLLMSAGVGAVLVAGTGVARADGLDAYTVANAPRVCAALDADSSVASVEAEGLRMIGDGLAPAEAGQVLARSVIGWCPGHTGSIEAFIAKYSDARTVIA